MATGPVEEPLCLNSAIDYSVNILSHRNTVRRVNKFDTTEG